MAAAQKLPGEIVWANCGHPLEDNSSAGKWRPMVLVRRTDAHWAAVGLTTNPRFGDGSGRPPVPNPRWAGLRGAGYLWGENLTRISILDIGDHIGWAHPQLIELIEQHVRLNDADREALHRSINWPEAG
jgi:hypothetical protein